MRRAIARAPRVLLSAVLIVSAFAAVSRDPYREAYRSWRQADPTLERDVAMSGPALSANIDRVANEAAKYAAARSVYLAQTTAEQARRLAFLNQERASTLNSDPAAAQIVSGETAAVRHSLDSYGNDPDPAIQQVRSLLERESLALVSLTTVLSDAQKIADQVRASSSAEQQARLKALGLLHDSAAASNQQIAETNQEGTAWADYYRLLSDAIRGVAPASEIPPAVAPAPEPRAPAASLPPLPLARYTGAWVFPAINGLFHGPQPEFIDLVVHEENGQASGTLFGRFKVTSGDPVIRFDFSGQFQKSRNQVFNLETSEGAKGTIELIPGPAFNLLEINFRIEPKPGKIQQGNAVLIKK